MSRPTTLTELLMETEDVFRRGTVRVQMTPYSRRAVRTLDTDIRTTFQSAYDAILGQQVRLNATSSSPLPRLATVTDMTLAATDNPDYCVLTALVETAALRRHR